MNIQTVCNNLNQLINQNQTDLLINKKIQMEGDHLGFYQLIEKACGCLSEGVEIDDLILFNRTIKNIKAQLTIDLKNLETQQKDFNDSLTKAHEVGAKLLSPNLQPPLDQLAKDLEKTKSDLDDVNKLAVDMNASFSELKTIYLGDLETRVSKRLERSWFWMLELLSINSNNKDFRAIVEELFNQKDITKTWVKQKDTLFSAIKTRLAANQAEALIDVINRFYSAYHSSYQQLQKRIDEILKEMNSLLEKGNTLSQQELCEQMRVKEKELENISETYDNSQFSKELKNAKSDKYDSDFYLVEGVCAGASLHYASEKLQSRGNLNTSEKKEDPGIQPDSRARYNQALTSLERYFKTTVPMFSKYIELLQEIQKYTAAIRKTSDPAELTKLRAILEDIEKEMQHISVDVPVAESAIFSTVLTTERKDLELIPLIESKTGRLGQNAVGIDEFLNHTLEQIRSSYPDQPLDCLIALENKLWIPDQTSTATASPASIFTQDDFFEKINERADKILGKAAPKMAKDVLKFKLFITELHQGASSPPHSKHVIYLSLSPPYELQDVNIPHFKGITAEDVNLFKQRVLAWLSLNPYQRVTGVYLIKPKSAMV